MKQQLTGQQRQQLCEMMHYTFVEARLLGWDNKAQQVADLAEAFHNLPRELYDPHGFDWNLFKGDIQGYQDTYHRQSYRGKFNYLTMLETMSSVV
jgi:hypothetical protein